MMSAMEHMGVGFWGTKFAKKSSRDLEGPMAVSCTNVMEFRCNLPEGEALGEIGACQIAQCAQVEGRKGRGVG